MAKLLTGTRIYGTGTVDTQLFVSGTNSATSTTTGALQVVGGVGVGGNLYVGGTIFGGIISGTASTATNADNVKTVSQTSSSSHYLAFVDANNSTAAYEALYTTSSFVINPQSGNVGIGTATPTWKVDANLGNITSGSISTGGYNVTGDALNNAGYTTYNMQLNNTTANASGYMRLARTASTVYLGMQIGSQSRDGIAFLTGATTPAESLRITAAGSVGIGTNSPSYPLHLLTTSTTSAAFRNSASTTTQILVGNTAGDTTIRTVGSGDSFIFSDTSKYLAFGTGATERLRITANGGISFGGGGTAYGVSGQILQSNGDAAPTWISTGSLAAANATTATHLSGGVAGQIPYQTAPGVTAFLSTGTAGDVLVSNGSSAATYNNTLRLAGSTNATSTTSGALQVVGGVGVGGDLFIQGDIRTNDTLFNLINANATTVNFAGDATTLNVGATSGATNVRNNLTVSGNLTVQGTTTIVDSTVTNIADPIITLGGGTGNSAPTADDNKDRGVAFKWVNNSGTTSTGFFGYDDSTGYLTYVQTATITNEVVSGTKGAMDVNLAGGTAMSIHYQSSPDNTAFLAASTSGYLLQTNGTSVAPSWVSASGVSAGSAANADNIRTIAQTGNAAHFLTFVDSNNASNAYESLYTTSSFVVNPQSGFLTVANTARIGATVAQGDPSTTDITANATLLLSGVGGNYLAFGQKASNLAQWIQSSYSNPTTAVYPISLNPLGGSVGIGTITPATKLDVAGTLGFTAGSAAGIIRRTTVNGSNGIRIQGNASDTINTDAAAGAYIAVGGGVIGDTFEGNIDIVAYGGNVDANRNQIRFSNRSGANTITERMRIDKDGNVGIGAVPTAVTGFGINKFLEIAGSSVPGIVFRPTGSTSEHSILGAGDGLILGATGAATASGNNVIRFFTSNVNSSNAPTERLRITAAGGIAFGGAANYGTSGNVLKSNGDAAPTWVDPSTLASASATNADAIRTVERTTAASHFLTFVDSNNASNAYESVYTTSSFSINPQSGAVSTGELSATKTGASLNFAFNAFNVDFTDSGGSATGIAFGVGGALNRKGALVYERKGAYGVGDFHFLQNTDNASVAIPTLAQAVVTIKNNGNVGIGTAAPGARLDIQANDGGDTRSIQTVLPPSASYNPPASNTPGKVVAGIKFNWYSDHWQIGAARSGATSVDGFVISRNNTSTVAITANGAIAFGLPTAYGTSGQILQSNGDAAPTWVSPSTLASGSATNADNIRTVAQAANTSYYPTFVDSNNASNAYELVYTTSSFSINPGTGAVTSPSLTVNGRQYFNGSASFYSLGSFNGSVQWILLGRFTGGGLGETLNLQFYGGNGYNGNFGQHSRTFIQIRTGNMNPVDTNISVDYHTEGQSSMVLDVRVRNVDSIAYGAVWDVYVQINGVCGNAYYIPFINSAATWSHTGTAGVTAPTVSSTVISGTNLFMMNSTSWFGNNVGIGNRTPIAKLHIGAEVEPNISSQSLFVQGSKTGYAGFKGLPQGQLLIYDDTASTAGSGGAIGFGANTGASQRTWIASINSERDSATNDATNYGGSLAFYTRPAQSTPLERMRIISTGTVVINPGGSNQIGPMLDIYGGGYSTYGALRLGDGSVGAHINWWDIGRENNFTGDFTFALNGTEKLRITTAGGISFGATGTAYGSSGQVLQSNGNAAPTWINQSSITSGGTALTATHVGFGSGSNTLTGSTNLTYASSILTISYQAAFNTTTPGFAQYGLHFQGQTTPDFVNGITFNGGTGAANAQAGIYVQGSGAYGTRMYFGTTDSYAVGSRTRMMIDSAGNVGIGTTSPISKLQVGNNTFSGANGVYSNARSGLSVNGSLTSIVYASTYNDATYPDYGMVFVHGPSTSNYNVWSISPDGPAKGSGLGFIYGANADNIHVGAPKVYFQGSTGNVGIGTSTPTAKLHVAGAINAYAPINSTINFSNSDSDNATYTNRGDRVLTSNGASWAADGRDPILTLTRSNSGLTRGQSIGLLLHNENQTTNSYSPLVGFSAQSNSGGFNSMYAAIMGKKTGQNLGVDSNWNRGELHFYANGNVYMNDTPTMIIHGTGVAVGTTSTLNSFEVAGTAGQLFSVSDSFTGTIFSVNDVSGIPSIEVLDTGLIKMAQYNGQLAIGTGTVASSTVTVSIYGMLQTMGTLGEIRASSEITAYFSSDQRLKENIKLIENPITIIDQIRGVTFDWTDEHMARRGGEDGYFVRKHDMGVIAQEVQAVLPELVGTREDGYLAVKYEKLVPLLIEAIKAQQKTIDSLVKDLNEVKEFIDQIKNKNGI